MRVLGVLVNTDFHSLALEISDYLIDAGHRVYVLGSDAARAHAWSQRYTYNFAMIDADAVGEHGIDFELGTTGDRSVFGLDKLSIQLEQGERCVLGARLIRGEGHALLCEQVFPWRRGHGLNELIAAVKDVCIDGIVLLAREHQPNAFSPLAPTVNHLAELAAWDEALQRLAREARERVAREDHFLLRDSIGPAPAPARTILDETLPRNLSPGELELMGVYLQMLLNGRQDGCYDHELQVGQGRIRKYVEVHRQDDFPTLARALNRAIHGIQHNRFFDYDIAFQQPVGLRLCYDAAEQGEGAPLTVIYDSASQRLVVRALEHPFFAHVSEHFEAFLAGLDRFRDGEWHFGRLLALHDSLYQRYVIDNNATEVPFPADRTIHGLIEEQARLRPDEVAVVHGEVALTYGELNRRANQLARLLLEDHAVTPGALIALYLGRNEHLMVAILGILKLGCAYVPLNLNSPASRTARILGDSRAALVLSESAHIEELTGCLQDHAAPVMIALDSAELLRKARAHRPADLEPRATSSDLAYVIYTSGTTGKPKGVAIEHRSFVNIATDISARLSFTPRDRILATTTIAFDISTLEILMPLMQGGSLVLADQEDLLDPGKLLFLIEERGVTVAQATPSLWQLIVPHLHGRKLGIRALCGGEALPAALARQLAAVVAQCWNVYGPTETTVWSTVSLIEEGNDRVLIGKPVANTQCYVLDQDLQPLPPGVLGELYIGGSGLARGYFGAEELTASKFVPNPLPGTPGGRIYRTGDLARYLSCGNLEFFGRNDFQVKLRGHRIELGEIESALDQHPAIETSLVLLKQRATQGGSESQLLVGYYVAPEPIDVHALKQHLGAWLPDYMVPAALVHLPRLPLNANGKVDRAALPEPALTQTEGHVAPQSELHRQLCRLWSEILDVPVRQIGITDDFFDLGGNSISGIRLMNRINSELKADIRIRDIFDAKTVEELSRVVNASLGRFVYQDYVIDGVDEQALYSPFPLNNVQQSYYFGRFHSFELSNVSTHIYSEFRYRHLDPERLELVLNRLLERHLALNTHFHDGQQCFQRKHGPYRVACHELQSEAELTALRDQYSHKVYRFDQYPLFDVFVSRLDGVHRLHISFDAIVIDMASFQILFEEWTRLYQDPTQELPCLDVSYRDYVLAYEEIRKGALFDKARRYWEDKADAYVFDLNLPLKARPSSVVKPFFQRKSKLIPAAVWDRLTAKCRAHGISPTAMILEVYGQVLSRWSGQDRLCVNLTLFNRLPLHADINRIIGDFTVLDLFDCRMEPERTIADRLRSVHDELLEDIENNLFDGVDVQRLLKARRGIPGNQVIAPAVLTSVLGMKGKTSMFELMLDDGYLGVDYAISQTAQVWLDNKAYETDEGFVAEWDYVDQLFDEQVIADMHEAYCAAIEQLADLDWEESTFPPVDTPAHNLALIEAANSARQARSEQTLFGLYEDRIGRESWADRVAVTDAARECSFTYGQLYRDSQALACFLAANASPGALIGVLAEKGYNQVVATLAIMKAGAAYLPLNCEWPAGRSEEVLDQAGTSILLVSRAQHQREEIRTLAGKYRLLDIDGLLAEMSATRPELLAPDALPTVQPDDVAYVIFTSGSTGKPKGVTISHRGAVNTIDAVNHRFGVGPGDSVLALSELSFDLSVYDLFGVLAAGGHIVFPNQSETKNPAHWVELVEKHRITMWNTVPQLAGLLVDEASDQQGRLASLRLFLLSGDWIPTSLPDRIRSQCPQGLVMSLGGATEGSIWSIWYEIDQVDPAWNSIPYGVAMPNQGMYVLDGQGRHCPVGVTGEIHIGGLGVALSYWRAPELTEARYIEHPELGRLYKTGDLGRWSRAGYIEFLGRNDLQVKLNGYRVELEEIAAKLCQLPGIDDAVVRIQKSEGNSRVVGYLVPAADPDQPAGNIDRDGFLLAGHGIVHEARARHELPIRLDEAAWRRRKSYRQFLAEPMAPGLLGRILEETAGAPPRASVPAPGKLDAAALAAWFSPLAALRLEDRALPKYRYPSAGSTYAVRSYLQLGRAVDGIGPGQYYFHPLEHRLCSEERMPAGLFEGRQSQIALSVHWPAISPIYGADARRLALLEAGHILYFLVEALRAQRRPHRVVVQEQALDADNALVCRILLEEQGSGFQPAPLRVRCFRKSADGASYAEVEGTHELALQHSVIRSKRSDAYDVLQHAQYALSLEGEELADTLFAAGYLFERLGERLYARNLGSCMLGLKPTERSLYSMAVGPIAPDDMDRAEIALPREDLRSAIDRELASVLPDYMRPDFYHVLDRLPLTPNGKLAVDQLPAVEIHVSRVAPKNAFEAELARIWQKVLDVPDSAISTEQSFFSLGGNSLSAMYLVRAMHVELGLPIKIEDIYQHNTIIALAEAFGSTAELSREEGEL